MRKTKTDQTVRMSSLGVVMQKVRFLMLEVILLVLHKHNICPDLQLITLIYPPEPSNCFFLK